MAKIKGLEKMSGADLEFEIRNGARFVVFQYCISIVIMTFKRASPIYLVKSGENAVSRGLQWTLLSLAFGWWGIPWGPIYTIQSLVTNFKGGKDVTADVIAAFTQSANQA